MGHANNQLCFCAECRGDILKNPKEYTLGEVIFICETEAHDYVDVAQRLLLFLQWRERQLVSYQVREDRERVINARQISTAISQRKCKSIDADLLESCVLVEE